LIFARMASTRDSVAASVGSARRLAGSSGARGAFCRSVASIIVI
jgi:hypothetical protein